MSDQETHQHGGFIATTTVPDNGDHPITTTTTTTATARAEISGHHGTLKRRSPSPSSVQEPNPKKLNLNGFTRLNLPLANPIEPSKHSLYRTLSAPISSSPNLQPQPTVLPNPLSPENVRTTSASPSPSPTHCASLPLPIPAAMRRSVSDIASPAYQQVLKTIASPASVCSDSSIRGKSPNFEKVMRLEEMTKEISHWCAETMRQFEQFDEENGGSDDNNNPQEWCEEATCQVEQFHEEDAEEDGPDDNNRQELQEDDPVTETEEAVSVDRAGDCLTIHFECPCGKGYQILLSGKNCYYKLVQY